MKSNTTIKTRTGVGQYRGENTSTSRGDNSPVPIAYKKGKKSVPAPMPQAILGAMKKGM